MELLHTAFILPHLLYCIESWGAASKSRPTKIVTIQKRLIRNIHGLDRLTHSAPYFRESQILTIHQLYDLRLLIISHQNFYSSTKTNKPHTHTTRHQTLALDDTQPDKPINNYGLKHILYAANKIWNSSAVNVREIRQISKFKIAAKEWVSRSS